MVSNPSGLTPWLQRRSVLRFSDPERQTPLPGQFILRLGLEVAGVMALAQLFGRIANRAVDHPAALGGGQGLELLQRCVHHRSSNLCSRRRFRQPVDRAEPVQKRALLEIAGP